MENNSKIKGTINNETIVKILETLLDTKTPFVPFISIDSVENIKKYLIELGKDRIDKDIVKHLWKNLLIDAISFLKHNDKREVAGSTGIAFDENIRLLNSYAVTDLTEYIENFSNFESILYGTDKGYRDHLNHVILVWAIGLDLILNNLSRLKKEDGFEIVTDKYEFYIIEKGSDKEIKLEKSLKDIEEGKFNLRVRFQESKSQEKNKKEKKGQLYITNGEIFAIWTIIALCHDLGYPVGKTSKINDEYKNILSHFGRIKVEEFNFSFNNFNDNLVEKFLNIVSSRPKTYDLTPNEIKDNLEKNESKSSIDIKNFGYTSIQSKFYDKLAKSLEEYKHGAFSALLIFKTLTYFLETDYSYSINDKLSLHDLKQFYLRREILRAICEHTCEKIYHVSLETIPFILILCDELQAWGRPRFEEIQEGVGESTEVLVNTIDFDQNSPEYGIDVKLTFNYENNVDGKNDSDKHARSMFKKFHHLLRSAKADEKRGFNFKWTMQMLNKNNGFLYEFIMRPKNDPTKLITTYKYKVTNGTRDEEPMEYFQIYDITRN